MFKTILLGGCVALLAVGAAGVTSAVAQTKAPVPKGAFVEICGEQGDGFFYIPGSETCLAIGGYVRFDALVGRVSTGYQNFNDPALWNGDPESAHEGPLLGNARGFHRTLSSVQASLQVDARSATEMGILRSYGEFHWSTTTGVPGTEIEVEKAFLQWGGLTAGKTQSFFDFFTGFDDPLYFATSASNRKLNVLAYTYAFGSGVTASLSIEDGIARRQTNGTDQYADGSRMPDIVANVRVDQQWGVFQVMAAYHQDWGDQQSTAAGTGPWQKDGFAVGAGLMLRLPEFGRGDKFWLQAAYAKGAVDYTTPDPYWGTDFADRSNTGVFQRNDWSAVAAYHHGFSKQYGVNASVSFLNSSGWVWRSTFTGANAVFGPKSADYRQTDVGLSFDWTPANGMLVRVGGEYRRVDYATPMNYFNRRPATVARNSDDGLVGYLRVVRKFGADDD